MKDERLDGLVLRATGHEVWVDVGGKRVSCLLRGRFRREKNLQVVAGDHVELSSPDSAGGPASIEKILPRRTWLSRYVGGRHASERVIVANIDTLVLVTSLRSPMLRYEFVDRMLVSAERGHNDVRICLNKTDLVRSTDETKRFVSLYSRIGYPVTETSAETGEGIAELKALLRGGIYAFVGQSGVGKSSLLNKIDEKLDLKVSRVAHKTGRGRHTTTYSQLFPIEGGFMADTPGMQTFGFPGTEKEELSQCFPEFRDFVTECRFQPCTHSHEPDCSVKAAHERGEVAESRLASYQNMLAEVELRHKKRF